MLSAPNCLMNIRWRLDDVCRDCVSSVHQLVMALSPCRDCDNVTFSPLLIMSWPRPRLWSPQTSLAPGGGMLRALIGKKFGKQRRKMFVLRTSQYDIDSKDQLIVRWITSTFLSEMAIMSDEEEIKQSKLSCFRTSQLWSRQDEPGGDWTGQWRIFFANGSSDWVPWPARAAEADTPRPSLWPILKLNLRLVDSHIICYTNRDF